MPVVPSPSPSVEFDCSSPTMKTLGWGNHTGGAWLVTHRRTGPKDTMVPSLGGAVDGKALARWPQKRFGTELGSSKAGDIVYKLLRKKMSEAEAARKELVAIRGGRTLSTTSSASSTPRASPQRGKSQSSKRPSASPRRASGQADHPSSRTPRGGAPSLSAGRSQRQPGSVTPASGRRGSSSSSSSSSNPRASPPASGRRSGRQSSEPRAGKQESPVPGTSVARTRPPASARKTSSTAATGKRTRPSPSPSPRPSPLQNTSNSQQGDRGRAGSRGGAKKKPGLGPTTSSASGGGGGGGSATPRATPRSLRTGTSALGTPRTTAGGSSRKLGGRPALRIPSPSPNKIAVPISP
jgi:hypothetical protein